MSDTPTVSGEKLTSGQQRAAEALELKKAATTTPATTQPATTQPATTQPATTQPATTITKPATTTKAKTIKTKRQFRPQRVAKIKASKAAEEAKKAAELKALQDSKKVAEDAKIAAEEKVKKLEEDLLKIQEQRKANAETSQKTIEEVTQKSAEEATQKAQKDIEEAMKTKSEELAIATAKIHNLEEKQAKFLKGQQQYAELTIDPNLPTILSIGENGFEEIIDLKKDLLNIDGTFRFLHTGAQKELTNLYGIVNNEQLRHMQRVLGIPKIGDKPLLFTYIEKQCKFEGYDDIISALEYRVKTLGENVAIRNNSFTTQVDKKRLQWIKELIENLKLLNNNPECPDVPIISDKSTKEICPCLEDLNLLRDLVVTIAIILGKTDPKMKEQLDNIKIESLLNRAAKYNAKTGSKFKDLIRILLKLASVEKKNASIQSDIVENEIQSILKKIYFSLTDTETTDTLNVDTLLGIINGLKDQLKETKTTIEAQTQTTEEIEAKITEAENKKKELEKNLMTILGNFDTILQSKISEITDKFSKLEIRVNELKTMLSEYENKIKSSNSTIEDLNKKLAAAESEKTELETTATTEKSKLTEAKTSIENLNNQLIIATTENTNLKKQIDELKNQITELEKQIAELKKKKNEEIQKIIDDNNTIIAKKENALAEKTTTNEEEINRLKEENKQIETLNSQIKDLNKEIETLKQQKQTDQNNKIAEINRLGEVIKALKTISSQKNATIAELTSTSLEKNATIDRLTKESSQKNATIAELERTSLEKNATIDRLTKESSQKNAKIKDLETQSSTKNTKIKDLNENIRQLRSLLDEINRQLESTKKETKNYLQNLLTMILIDPTLANTLQKFLEEGVIPDELKYDLCSFLKYMSKLVNLQYASIQNINVGQISVNNNDLIKELVIILQQFFMFIVINNDLPTELILQGDFPVLKNNYDNLTLSNNINNDIYFNNYSYAHLTKYTVIKDSDGTFKIEPYNNTSEGIPLVKLAILLIQKWKTILDEKIKELDCNNERVIEAPPIKPKKAPKKEKTEIETFAETPLGYIEGKIARINASIKNKEFNDSIGELFKLFYVYDRIPTIKLKSDFKNQLSTKSQYIYDNIKNIFTIIQNKDFDDNNIISILQNYTTGYKGKITIKKSLGIDDETFGNYINNFLETIKNPNKLNNTIPLPSQKTQKRSRGGKYGKTRKNRK